MRWSVRFPANQKFAGTNTARPLHHQLKAICSFSQRRITIFGGTDSEFSLFDLAQFNA
jgi:hypothetical protein